MRKTGNKPKRKTALWERSDRTFAVASLALMLFSFLFADTRTPPEQEKGGVSGTPTGAFVVRTSI
jgi:hypothetical protein